MTVFRSLQTNELNSNELQQIDETSNPKIEQQDRSEYYSDYENDGKKFQ